MDKIQYILFDLDGTLYDDETGLFVEVGNRIEGWIAEQLALSLDAAKQLRHEYYIRYGTTMAGLLHDRPDLDIDAYLNYVHDVDVAIYLHPDPRLNQMLNNLTLPKVIFTNSISSWAERITVQLGVRQHFQDIFDVRAVDYHCKPHPHAFSRVINQLGVSGDACVMLDDQPSYLAGAKRAGMKTVLVRPDWTSSNGIDAAVPHILDAELVLRQWCGG
ncbi:MAG: pyrimidine 5'-nucleotidase [Anaerolineae bacterium]|nr:pyrimidine 5'-nucleotidase [Anaerolineae bacterium]